VEYAMFLLLRQFKIAHACWVFGHVRMDVSGGALDAALTVSPGSGVTELVGPERLVQAGGGLCRIAHLTRFAEATQSRSAISEARPIWER
jgi:hypothetical protein